MNRIVILLSMLGVLLVKVGWYLLLVKPTQERITEAEDLVVEAEDRELLLRAQRAGLQKVEDNMLAYLAAIGELDRSIPSSPQTASLIDDLSALAAETGVVWESGAYGNPTEVEGQEYLEIPVNVEIEGQFFEVLGYLYGIADMDRLIRVESVGISPTQDDSGFTILKVPIAAKAFTSTDVAIPTVDGEGAEDPGTDEEPIDGAQDAEAEASIRVWAT